MQKFESAMRMALNAAEKFLGATAPMPPMGVIALDKNEKVLLGAATQTAEQDGLETLLNLANKLGKLSSIHTLVFSLEPTTLSAAEKILKNKSIKKIIIGCSSPISTNSFQEKLKAAGLDIQQGPLEEECRFFIRAFEKKARTTQPYVTIKSVLDSNENLLPVDGPRSLSSKAALIYAHELRKRADAIWTGSGTILNDEPDFRVNWVPDHSKKKRFLLLSDRRKRISSDWIKKAEKDFILHWAETLEEGLAFLGKSSAHEVIVEAGPLLRDAWLKSDLWDEHVEIIGSEGQEDEIRLHFRNE